MKQMKLSLLFKLLTFMTTFTKNKKLLSRKMAVGASLLALLSCGASEGTVSTITSENLEETEMPSCYDSTTIIEIDTTTNDSDSTKRDSIPIDTTITGIDPVYIDYPTETCYDITANSVYITDAVWNSKTFRYEATVKDSIALQLGLHFSNYVYFAIADTATKQPLQSGKITGSVTGIIDTTIILNDSIKPGSYNFLWADFVITDSTAVINSTVVKNWVNQALIIVTE